MSDDAGLLGTGSQRPGGVAASVRSSSLRPGEEGELSGDAFCAERPREFHCLYSVDTNGERLFRLLYLLVFCHYLLYPFALGAVTLLFLYYAWVPRTWVLLSLAAYMLQLLIYRPHIRGGWRNEWFRGLAVWDVCQTWLDPTWIVEAELDPTKTYVFAIAPHGILSICRLLFEGQVWHRLFPGWTKPRPRWAAATPQFLVPGCRELMLMFAMDAQKKYFIRELKNQRSILLLPGGTQELMLTDTSQDTKHVILDRMGFVKYAYQENVEIVPIMVFGEKWCYNKYLLPAPVRRFLYRFKIPGTFFTGWCGTFLPNFVRKDPHGHGQPIRAAVVVGKAIPCPKGLDEGAAVERMHAMYTESMGTIFEKYKARFGYEPAQTFTPVSATPKSK